ncbi:aminopeptidase P family protein [Flammeovirga aprica]|uniref:Xaa-Pro aminopeptidase n=1 Tax=Flammeovirga aprica JL-4 TaxID=694437 RepID=A0A7X9XA41_9BACT|nr:aminopeptidase P family protein [Flammeovirga aprica]NME69269.1 M24 family metallopeptidase [Flammeovirga aprica JL-4]
MKKITLLLSFLVLCYQSFSQYKHAPTDFTSKNFHQSRRDSLRAKMPDKSVAIFFANPVRNRANDVNYVYHQDPDFFYLTGYREPNAVLFLFKEPYTLEDGEVCTDLIYVQPKDEYDEMWNGARLGIEGTHEQLGFQNVRSNQSFRNVEIDFQGFDHVLTFDPYRDVSNNIYDPYELFDFIQIFKKKAHYPAYLNPVTEDLYNQMRGSTLQTQANVAQFIGSELINAPILRLDQNIISFLTAPTPEQRVTVGQNLSTTNIQIMLLDSLMKDLRQVKEKEEINLLKKAVFISCVAQKEVMKAIKPGMSETEIQGIHEFIYKKYGAEYEGYPSIVGAGENACMLHYISNNKPKMEDRELILMDCGAEYRGYTADVTRTIPVNGTFTKEQKLLYNIVLDAQTKAIKACKAGNTFEEVHEIAANVIGKGLTKLKIIAFPEDYARYFPHGLMHHIGLDVHDKGHYTKLLPNMVVTVEPGIYIPEDSECDEKWWGIGIRIEDDILITADGPVNLSASAPRTISEIETLMKAESAFDKIILPNFE